MGSSIVHEFCHREMFIPVFWNALAEDLEICFELSIDSFYLSICLGMICGTDSLLNFAKFHKTPVGL